MRSASEFCKIFLCTRCFCLLRGYNALKLRQSEHHRCFLRNSFRRNETLRGLFSETYQRRKYCTVNRSDQIVLGIETSCDDTGVAIINSEGKVLGESINSQLKTHVEYGGIIPPIARDLHKEHIKNVAQKALEQSGLQTKDITAVAVTVQPGLLLCLKIGVSFAKELAQQFSKPLIPIHHMEAHALAVRMVHRVDFPYLVLLISGGHCQIALVQDVDKFILLGETVDDAPGEAFDKVARRLKVNNIPELYGVGGGKAIEYLAKKGNPKAIDFPVPMTQYRDCNFSFAGLKNSVYREIVSLERQYGIEADALLPNLPDVCASFQHAVAVHLMKRVERALIYCEMKDLLPASKKVLVISGGVACNSYIKFIINQLCEYMDTELAVPPPSLCTDNGIMIAWNGIEKLKTDGFVGKTPEEIIISPKCSLGKNISLAVREANIKNIRLKLKLPEIQTNTGRM